MDVVVEDGGIFCFNWRFFVPEVDNLIQECDDRRSRLTVLDLSGYNLNVRVFKETLFMPWDEEGHVFILFKCRYIFEYFP